MQLPLRIFNLFISTSMGQKSFCCHHYVFPEGNAETNASLFVCPCKWHPIVQMEWQLSSGTGTDCSTEILYWDGQHRHYFLTPFKPSVKNCDPSLELNPRNSIIAPELTLCNCRAAVVKIGGWETNTQWDVVFLFLWGWGGPPDWNQSFTSQNVLCVSCVVGVIGQRAPCRMTVPCRCVRRRCRRRKGSSQRAATHSGWRQRRWALEYSSSACISLRNHRKPRLIRSPQSCSDCSQQTKSHVTTFMEEVEW